MTEAELIRARRTTVYAQLCDKGVIASASRTSTVENAGWIIVTLDGGMNILTTDGEHAAFLAGLTTALIYAGHRPE